MAPDEAARIQLVLKAIRVTGSTVFSPDELKDHFEDLLGQRVTLSQIFDVAAKITAMYGKAGYGLSRVIVPPQELEPSGAVVELRVLEGYIDEVVWPEELKGFRDFFTGYAAAITAERPVRIQTMERYLLLANDLPGLTFRSRLEASKSNPLASTLFIAFEEKNVELRIGIDNRGTEGTGPFQPSAIATVNNFFGGHEQFELGYITAGPDRGRMQPELHYLIFGYRQALTSEGLTLDFSGNASWGDPGTVLLNALDFGSEGENFSIALIYPIIRTRPETLSATLAFDIKNSRGRQLGVMSSNDRLRIVRGELSYEKADELKGINQVVLVASHGIEGLGSTSNGNPAASRANGRVDFFKTTVFAARTQSLPESFSLYLAGYGQWTKQPLLSSQECGYGGAFMGRAFDPSIVTGDTCVKVLGELRYDHPITIPAVTQIFNTLQWYGFADYGRIWNLKAPLGTPRNDEAASAGLGVRFGKANWSVDVQAARIVERPNSVAVSGAWHGFFSLTAKF